MPIFNTLTDVSRSNLFSTVYISGGEFIDGSCRLTVDSDKCVIQTRNLGAWVRAELELSPSTLYMGKNLALSTAGHYIVTERTDGSHRELYAHTEFSDSGTGVLKHACLSPPSLRAAIRTDDANEITGTQFDLLALSNTAAFVEAVYIRIGSTEAGDPVDITTYGGSSDTDPVIWDERLPASQFQSLSISVTSVTNDSGDAVFHFAAGNEYDVYVNKPITLSGFSNYSNSSHTISNALDGVSFKLTGVSYNGNDTGTWTSNERRVDLRGWLEIEANGQFLIRFTSDTALSLRSDATQTYLWMMGDFSDFTHNHTVSTSEWISGASRTLGEWFFSYDDLKVYKAVSAGTKGATFAAEKSSAWREIGEPASSGDFGYWNITAGLLKNNAGTDLHFNDGSNDRLEVHGLASALYSPDRSLRVGATDSLAYLADSSRNRVFVDTTETELVSPDGTRLITLSNSSISVTGDFTLGADQHFSAADSKIYSSDDKGYLTFGTSGDLSWHDVDNASTRFLVNWAGTTLKSPNGSVSIAVMNDRIDCGSAGGFLPPQMDETDRDALTETAGMVIYNTDSGSHEVWNSVNWFKTQNYVIKKTYTYNPSTTSTIYTQYLGTYTSEYGVVDIRIQDAGTVHGASSFFRVTRHYGQPPVLEFANDGSWVANYSIYYRIVDSLDYELFFKNNGGTDSNITHTAYITYPDKPTDSISASNDTDVVECPRILTTRGHLTKKVGIGLRNPSGLLHLSGSEATSHGYNTSIVIENTASGGGSWYLRAGATGTSTPAGGFSIADTSFYRLAINSSGHVHVGGTSPSGMLDVDQSSTTAAVPTLYLRQADVSEEMIEFNTTIGTGNAIEAVGGKSLTTTHFIKVTLPGSLTRYIPCGTIA